MLRKVLFTTVATAALLVGALPAHAAGNTYTDAGATGNIVVALTVSHNTACSELAGGATYQCTPVATVAAHTSQPILSTGGDVTWSGYASCSLREKSDGFNNNWTSWRSCGSKSDTETRTWAAGSSPAGGLIQFTWPQEFNGETAFAQDCIEVSMYVSGSATAHASTSGVVIDTASVSGSFSNVIGICE